MVAKDEISDECRSGDDRSTISIYSGVEGSSCSARTGKNIKRIAVLTSGGDAPGMNTAIRAVVRTALDKDWGILGVRHGFTGLIAGDFIPLGAREVGGIIQQGGTILGSSRGPEFKTGEGRLVALQQLHQRGISALVIIGGNGSQMGAHALMKMGFSVVGVPSTAV